MELVGRAEAGVESCHCVLKGCPCGYLHHPGRPCLCGRREIEKYRKRVSGPILDRIDLHVEVPLVDVKEFSDEQQLKKSLELSSQIRTRVMKARRAQGERFIAEGIHTNAEMKNKQIKKYCRLSKEVRQVLLQAVRTFKLSARSYFKTIKVARTIADLDGYQDITVSHMAEALQYRPKIDAG